MRLRLSPAISTDLEKILDYIAKDSPRHALHTVRFLRASCTEIAKVPTLYRVRPEIGSDARLATAGSYVILFRIMGTNVRIERIVHGSRDLIGMLTEQ